MTLHWSGREPADLFSMPDAPDVIILDRARIVGDPAQMVRQLVSHGPRDLRPQLVGVVSEVAQERVAEDDDAVVYVVARDPVSHVQAVGPVATPLVRDHHGHLVERAQPLVEALWEAERDAQPLATPEDKAGLKARLLDSAATIQHPDIRSLYRRELLARFDAFAWAPKARRPGARTRRRTRSSSSSRARTCRRRGGGVEISRHPPMVALS